MNIKTTFITITTLLAAITSQAEMKSFDFKDPKGVNNVNFSLDAPLESISGNGNGIAGKVMFDSKHPEKLSGEITLETSSIMVANSMMKDHLHSENWLDVEKYPTISFISEGIKNLESDGNQVTGELTGTITIKGISKQIVVPVKISYLPGKVSDRTNGQANGDLLVVRSKFSINRSDFDIQAGQMTDKVSETIELQLAIAGAAYED